jgi:hypothetical protein
VVGLGAGVGTVTRRRASSELLTGVVIGMLATLAVLFFGI